MRIVKLCIRFHLYCFEHIFIPTATLLSSFCRQCSSALPYLRPPFEAINWCLRFPGEPTVFCLQTVLKQVILNGMRLYFCLMSATLSPLSYSAMKYLKSCHIPFLVALQMFQPRPVRFTNSVTLCCLNHTIGDFKDYFEFSSRAPHSSWPVLINAARCSLFKP